VAFERLPTYTVRQLESKATDYLREHLGPDVPIPVDVELLVERVEGIDLDEWPKLRTNHGIEGGVWRDLDTGELSSSSQKNSWRISHHGATAVTA
jgi:hypothetical protein